MLISIFIIIWLNRILEYLGGIEIPFLLSQPNLPALILEYLGGIEIKKDICHFYFFLQDFRIPRRD